MTKSRKAENEQKHRRWQKILKAWKESGKTQADYCREHELRIPILDEKAALYGHPGICRTPSRK